MENIKEIRLKLLQQNFREVKNVKRGFRDLNELINTGNDKTLKRLLRNHWSEPIMLDAEVKFRDNVDFLIGYYSILAVAVIAGYVPEALNEKNLTEARYVLSDKNVKTFYKEHYRLYLPEFLLNHLNNVVHNSNYEVELRDADEGTAGKFEYFLQVLRTRMEDPDIDQFLWFLDDGYEYDNKKNKYINLDDLWKSLRDADSLLKKHSDKTKRNNPLNKALMGFVKFVSYLEEYEELLKSCDDNPLLQSAIWHMESYWFDHLQNKLGKVLKEGVQNMIGIINSGYYYNVDDGDITEEVIEEWRMESKKEADKAMSAINYLFNDELGKPLVRLMNLNRL